MILAGFCALRARVSKLTHYLDNSVAGDLIGTVCLFATGIVLFVIAGCL